MVVFFLARHALLAEARASILCLTNEIPQGTLFGLFWVGFCFVLFFSLCSVREAHLCVFLCVQGWRSPSSPITPTSWRNSFDYLALSPLLFSFLPVLETVCPPDGKSHPLVVITQPALS